MALRNGRSPHRTGGDRSRWHRLSVSQRLVYPQRTDGFEEIALRVFHARQEAKVAWIVPFLSSPPYVCPEPVLVE
jgi:hypothetical protein